MRILTLTCLALFLCCAGSDAQVLEWSYDLEKGAHAPTLFPDENDPTGVVIGTGRKVVRIAGNGKVLWTHETVQEVSTPITSADLDGDGTFELLFTQSDGSIHCVDENAQPVWSHVYDVEAGWFKSVVAADVHPSPGLEVLFGFNDGWLRCLSATGDLLWEFFGDLFRVGAIAAGDVDADGAPEVVYGTDNGHVYCLNGWGDVEWRFNELAPYGRSGMNLADLDNNGVPEVLFTRSNVNNNTCLAAVDGIDATVLWRTKDVMQGYVSNAVVDFEGDGLYEVLHGDKGNNCYAENSDGSRRWHARLDARGMFWAPAVADIDGDGQLETVPGMRGQAPDSGASSYLIGTDGTVKQQLMLGKGTNAGPAVGDVDGDGELELIAVVQDPNQVQCLTWNAGGRVGWPSLRGNSRMTAKARNVPDGSPSEAAAAPDAGDGSVAYENTVWGENEWTLRWSEPAQEGSFIEIAVVGNDGTRCGKIVDLRTGVIEAKVAWELARGDMVEVRARLFTPGSREPQFALTRAVTPVAPEYCSFDEVEAACESATEAGNVGGADISGIAVKLVMLEAARDAVAGLLGSGASNESVAAEATALRKQARELLALAKAMGAFWRDGGAGNFLVWQDLNPWDRFDPAEVPDQFDMAAPVRFTAYRNEFENAALTLFNSTSNAIDVRCVFNKPSMEQQWYRPEEPLAGNITLRRHVPVAAQWSDRVFDALPELDRSRSITIPPGEGRQLWLVVRTHDLEPGTHELTLYLGSLDKPPTFREVPIEIEVWPIGLPTDVYAKMNWTRIDEGAASDQGIQDIVDHGMKVCYGPAMPAVPVDERGELAGTVDWSEFDRTIKRVPQPWTFLWGAPPSRKWPEGINPDQDSREYFNGFRTALREMAQHLTSIGIDYHYWAFYPVDEPWNTGFTHIPHLKHFSEMVKKADPRAQMYTDPAGLVRVEYLEEFKDLIDVWQPELNTLKRDPKLVEWFQQNAKRFWFYEAPGPAKDWHPLGHYRAYGWYAWHFGVEGGGYWIYKALDVWWPVEGGNWSAVYQTNTDVVTSRRWEADRDGIEDYRAFHVLSDEIERAREAGHAAEAEAAQALIDEAVEAIIGWNLRNIDEITRVTRDYELDWELLCEYRTRIAQEIMKLRSL